MCTSERVQSSSSMVFNSPSRFALFSKRLINSVYTVHRECMAYLPLFIHVSLSGAGVSCFVEWQVLVSVPTRHQFSSFFWLGRRHTCGWGVHERRKQPLWWHCHLDAFSLRQKALGMPELLALCLKVHLVDGKRATSNLHQSTYVWLKFPS